MSYPIIVDVLIWLAAAFSISSFAANQTCDCKDLRKQLQMKELEKTIIIKTMEAETNRAHTKQMQEMKKLELEVDKLTDIIDSFDGGKR